jgi:UDP-N-acetylglucosamine diphosphorylase / glucose-1-phosphate thymidylyltransferase / UDP-N-acetylgalactosamine diphosphorylase / glucosamine-1-phosphate N-acetyltransferase / galactosamine-1-phosphate N-acetyltransferase
VSVAVVMAAGLGTRLRPLTERWAKPVLPIDGRPVIVTLIHELAADGFDSFVVVTGHLAAQVEELLSPLPYRMGFVSQPEPVGSADAVRRAQVEPPFLVTAADTVYERGDPGRFWQRFQESGAAGAISIRSQPGRPDHTRIRVEGGRVLKVVDPSVRSGWTSAPLMAVGLPVAEQIAADLPGPPFELAYAFQRAIDAGERVEAIEIGKTRDLTDPLDLVEENFSYLR